MTEETAKTKGKLLGKYTNSKFEKKWETLDRQKQSEIVGSERLMNV